MRQRLRMVEVGGRPRLLLEVPVAQIKDVTQNKTNRYNGLLYIIAMCLFFRCPYCYDSYILDNWSNLRKRYFENTCTFKKNHLADKTQDNARSTLRGHAPRWNTCDQLSIWWKHFRQHMHMLDCSVQLIVYMYHESTYSAPYHVHVLDVKGFSTICTETMFFNSMCVCVCM